MKKQRNPKLEQKTTGTKNKRQDQKVPSDVQSGIKKAMSVWEAGKKKSRGVDDIQFGEMDDGEYPAVLNSVTYGVNKNGDFYFSIHGTFKDNDRNFSIYNDFSSENRASMAFRTLSRLGLDIDNLDPEELPKALEEIEANVTDIIVEVSNRDTDKDGKPLKRPVVYLNIVGAED